MTCVLRWLRFEAEDVREHDVHVEEALETELERLGFLWWKISAEGRCGDEGDMT